jgi:hypothetical protein
VPPDRDADDAREALAIARERGALFFEKHDEPLRDAIRADELEIDSYHQATAGARTRARGYSRHFTPFLSADVR